MFKKILFNYRVHFMRRCSSLAEVKSATAGSVISSKRTQKKPFVKSILAGVYDEEFLIYPELTSEKLKVLENRFCEFSKNISNTKESFKQIIQKLYQESSSTIEGEICANNFVNLTRLSEAIPLLPLSLRVEIHKICVNIISKYGNEVQKKKYLPGLLKGDTSIAFALGEENTGSDPSSINTLALRNRESSTWKISGEKTWVTNAESADLFLVFSKMKFHEKSQASQDVSVFLVERKCPGVIVEQVSTNALDQCGIGKLILDNVSVSDSDIVGDSSVGYDIATNLLNSYKNSLSSSFSTQLKELLNETVKFISNRKQSVIDLKDSESIRKKLSDVFLTIYTLDSMLYLTAGMMDNFEVDMTLESAVIHLFCTQNGVAAVENCLEMLGSRSYDNSLPFARMRNDFKALSMALHSRDICKLYISLTGIQHSVHIRNNDIYKIRNSLNYPLFFIKKLISNSQNVKDNPKLNLNLYMNLHPSLQPACNELEYCVLRLQYCIEKLLVRHGSEMGNRQLDLERLSDIIIDIYGMTAVLGRSSRSYCTGIKWADDEILLAKTFCQDALSRCKNSLNELLENDVMSKDLFHFKLADHLIEQGGYFIEHPLTQNIG